MFRFYTPLKHQKTIGFSMYSGGGGWVEKQSIGLKWDTIKKVFISD